MVGSPLAGSYKNRPIGLFFQSTHDAAAVNEVVNRVAVEVTYRDVSTDTSRLTL